MELIIGAIAVVIVVVVGVEMCLRESAASARAEKPDKIRHYRSDM